MIENNVELGPVSILKSVQITASHKNKTCRGSVTPKLTNSAYVDMKASSSEEMELIIYGGQKVDLIRSSNEVIVIKGKLIHENIKDNKVDVTKYVTLKPTFEHFKIPAGWSDGENVLQKGDIPEGRTGARMSLIKDNLLMVTGGHCKRGVGPKLYHPTDNCNLLSYPDMTWTKLEANDLFQRSFHCQAVNKSNILFIVGGMTFNNEKKQWTTIHPLNEVISVELLEDRTYIITTFVIESNIRDISQLTNYSYCNINNILYVYSGFHFPKYNHQERNLFQFQPPIANKNKLPEFSTNLYMIDFENKSINVKYGPIHGGASGGSIVPLSSDADLLIHADPKVYIFTRRNIEKNVK